MIKPGDVFSIEVRGGKAYFQFINKNKTMSSLIRVLPGIHEQSSGDISDIAIQPTRFWTFFPVAESLKDSVIQKEGNYPIPVHAQKMPLFRTGVVNPETKRVETWWLWDGEKSWKAGNLTDDQRRLPIRGNWNDTLLKERIEQGWLPELDPR